MEYNKTVTLTPMQEAAGKVIRAHKNVVLLSPTGSGKTLAFLLPIVEQMSKGETIYAVVIVPSRELAQQIESVFKQQLSAMTASLRATSLCGGRPAMEEHRVLREVRPQIIFATPGRFLDHIRKGNINIADAKTLVIDEFDKCLELGFREEMDEIASVFSGCPQVVLTSATPSTSSTEPNAIIESRRWEILDFTEQAESLKQRLSIKTVQSQVKDKLETLAKLLSLIGAEQSIVFVAHRESAERVANYLAKEKFAVVTYHGGMEQDCRERALYRFRSQSATVLVSTDLAARGLDIPSVRNIIHYHLPLDEATFTHRIGRTARWEDSGNAYLLVGPEEKVPDFVNLDIENIEVSRVRIHPRQPRWTLLYIGRGKKDKLSRADVLGFLCKKGGLTSAQIGRIDLAPHASYVAVERTAIKNMLSLVNGEKIKGMKTIIEPIRH